MNFEKYRILLVGLLLLAAFAPRAQAGIELARDGATDYAIHLSNDSGGLQHAADQLATHLQRVTGAKFPIKAGAPASGAAKVIRLALAPQSIPGGSQAFRIDSEGDGIRISGNSLQGLHYGVYRFLEQYAGVHWFGPGEPDFAEQPTLNVAIESRDYAPRFDYREVFYRHADDPGFAAHNRLNGRFGHRRQQPLDARQGAQRSIRQVDIFKLVPREKYAQSHPEYFGGGQLRFANDEVRRVAAQRLEKMLARWDTRPDYILIAHADRETYHRAGADAELIEKHNAPSAAYLEFVRHIAGRVETGDTKILAQAYLWSRKPPEDMPALPENMGVMLSGIERDFSEPMDAPTNRDFLSDLDGWARLTSHIIVWDYITNFAGYIQPYPNLHTLAANLRALAQRDAVQGVFAQGAYNSPGAEFAELRTWLLARLMWDPQRDANALIDTFIDGYYGPGAPFMRDYLQALQASAQRWDGRLEDKVSPDAGYLDRQFLREADRLLARAENATQGRSKYLQRVQTARIPVDYAVLSNRSRLPGDHDERLARLRDNLQQAGVSAYREGGGADPQTLLQALAVDRSGSQRPEACSGLARQDCVVIEDDALRLSGGGAKLVPDSTAADGGAAGMPGGSTVWGLQLPLSDLLPEQGRWQIKVRARIESKKGASGAGLQMGLHPGSNKSFDVSEVAGAQYRTVALPGAYQRGDADYLWLAPAGNSQVERIYIDRIIAVPAS